MKSGETTRLQLSKDALERALAALRFGEDGLIPAVLQESAGGAVLMVGFMNREAVERTLTSGLVHFWSRSRGKLWFKGEQSGHYQQVVEARLNCEDNSLLLLVRPLGPICHEGYATCYFRRIAGDGSLELIAERQFEPGTVYLGRC